MLSDSQIVVDPQQLAGLVEMMGVECVADVAVQAARQRDKPGATFLVEPFPFGHGLAAMLALEVPVVASVLRLGRHLEVRLRLRFLDRIARLPDRYFRSRLASDMAERSHNTHMLHEVPEIGATLLRVLL